MIKTYITCWNVIGWFFCFLKYDWLPSIIDRSTRRVRVWSEVESAAAPRSQLPFLPLWHLCRLAGLERKRVPLMKLKRVANTLISRWAQLSSLPTTQRLSCLCYSGTWPSYLTDLLSLRLVGTVGARINVRSSHSQPRPTVTWIWTLRFSQLQPSAFNNRANPLSGFIKNPTLQCLVTWLGRVEFNSLNSLTIKGDNYHMFPIDTWTSVPGWHWFEQMMAKGERLRIPEAKNYARRKGCVRKWIRITIGLFADTAVSVWCVWWALVGGITEFGQ